jgi:Na+/proline symporter
LSEAGRVRAARVCIVLLGLIAFAIALRSTTIHELVETASSIGSAGLIVVALFGLFTRFGGPAAALAALLTGSIAWVVGLFFAFTSVPYVLAVGLAVLAYVLVGLLTRRSAR